MPPTKAIIGSDTGYCKCRQKIGGHFVSASVSWYIAIYACENIDIVTQIGFNAN